YFTSRTTLSVTWSDGGPIDIGSCFGYTETCYAALPYQALAQAGTATPTATTPPPGGGAHPRDIAAVAGNVLLPRDGGARAAARCTSSCGAAMAASPTSMAESATWVPRRRGRSPSTTRRW